MILEGAPSSRGSAQHGLSELTDLAALLILRLLQGLKQSLILSSSQAYLANDVVTSEGGSPTQTQANASQGAAAEPPIVSTPATSPLLGTRLPRPLPKVPEGKLRGAALAHFLDGVVNVTATAFCVSGRVRKTVGVFQCQAFMFDTFICIPCHQIFGLLKNPDRHFQLMPLVEELVPLLLISREGPIKTVSEQAS